MLNLHHPTTQMINGKMFVTGYTMPSIRVNWQQSKVSYPVEDEEMFLAALCDLKKDEYQTNIFDKVADALLNKGGINIDRLKDRLELIENFAEGTAYVRLKPIQEEAKERIYTKKEVESLLMKYRNYAWTYGVALKDLKKWMDVNLNNNKNG